MPKMSQEQVKEQLAKAMDEYNLVIMNKEDAVSAIEFVRELLLIHIDECKANYPNATVSLKNMETAFRVVGDLTELTDLMEG